MDRQIRIPVEYIPLDPRYCVSDTVQDDDEEDDLIIEELMAENKIGRADPAPPPPAITLHRLPKGDSNPMYHPCEGSCST